MPLPAITTPHRITLPRQLLTERGFVYSNAASTDVAATIRRERERLARQKLQAELAATQAQQALPGIPTTARTTRRLRAGLQQPLALPQL